MDFLQLAFTVLLVIITIAQIVRLFLMGRVQPGVFQIREQDWDRVLNSAQVSRVIREKAKQQTNKGKKK